MDPYYSDEQVTLHLGDSLAVLPTLADASVDAVVCDPPYELNFMGRAWDASGIAYNTGVWRECLRVLKPGGHLAAFGGARTYHRMAVAIEDAGFEIRDSLSCAAGSLAWYYGSGFPKSKAVSRDPAVCQCVPDVRDPATEEAAESAAEVLLADLRRSGKEDASRISDLHGLPVALHPDYAVPGGAEEDVLATVCGESGQCSSSDGSSAPAAEDDQADVCGMRRRVRAPARVVEEGQDADLFSEVQRGSTRAGLREARAQGAGGLVDGVDRAVADSDAGGDEPGMEGRGDVQEAEGQLHRSAVRPLPAGPEDDGEVGRLHRRAPSGDGSLDWSSATPLGGREPHRPQSAEQHQGESGAVPVERGPQARRGWPVCGGCGKPRLPAGLGTALKPAWEPIVLARKPLAGTVAATVLEHGTGAINIDGCRIAHGDDVDLTAVQRQQHRHDGDKNWRLRPGHEQTTYNQAGRWPTNVLLSHPPLIDDHGQPVGDACADGCIPGCPVAEMDRQSGHLKSGVLAPHHNAKASPNHSMSGGNYEGRIKSTFGGDEGGASRFFPTFRYEAKAPATERPRGADGSAHPTVKPLDLMQWLVRLVTPPGGTVLDPFAGTGTTLEAAALEDMHAVGIEQHEPYAELCRARLTKPRAIGLFAEPA